MVGQSYPSFAVTIHFFSYIAIEDENIEEATYFTKRVMQFFFLKKNTDH